MNKTGTNGMRTKTVSKSNEKHSKWHNEEFEQHKMFIVKFVQKFKLCPSKPSEPFVIHNNIESNFILVNLHYC